MLFLYLLIIWQIQAVPHPQLNMYNTNSYKNGHCLFTSSAYKVDEQTYSTSKVIHQITAYCIRISEDESFTLDASFQNIDDHNFTFAELKEQNITSHMLLSWSAPIDLAEQYEIFLKSGFTLSSDETMLFYNCTSLRFGPSCRFTFDFGINISFGKLINAVSLSRERLEYDVKVTCYKHHHCETFLSCLDWREICDRKNDCLDGSDEQQCWQLEVNTCADNEYQCHNGQCIPIEFYHDNLYVPDCLDQTDEAPREIFFTDCSFTRDFVCEEAMCRPGEKDFSCGDGECLNFIHKCYNGRSNIVINDLCSYAIACLMKLYDQVDADSCEEFCSNIDCMKENCPERYEFRFIAPLLGHIQFIFSNDLNPDKFLLPEYVCYDEKFCANFLPVTERIGNLTCRNFNDLGLENIDSYDTPEVVFKSVKDRFRGCLITASEIYQDNYSTRYQCEKSTKFISKQRLLDGIHDCPFDDDETYNESCSISDAQQRFNCTVDGNEKCFSPLIVLDDVTHCENDLDENNRMQQLTQNQIYFPLICDGITDLLPIWIDGRNETDETECKRWPCNNTYSRCDYIWLCDDGADEINCRSSICPAFHHECIFPNDTSKVSCLPIAEAGNGIDNCLGGTDEPKNYAEPDFSYIKYKFHCWNDTTSIAIPELCNKEKDCRYNDDEILCDRSEFLFDLCLWFNSSRTDVESFLCNFIGAHRLWLTVFKLQNISAYPSSLMNNNITGISSTWIDPDLIDEEFIHVTPDDPWWCNLGIPIRFQMDVDQSELLCLCPPSYYGIQCQYQSQRVSLTLQIQVSSDWRNIFIFLISLIDNEGNIQSYDHIQYLPMRDCADKFNIYLLYSTQPKNASRNYSVQIDAFFQSPLNYRASWIFPLQFLFLPVQRLPVLLKVPTSNIKSIHECWPSCIHGQCYPYVNNPNSTFCRCEPGWSGTRCDVNHTCHCASGSLCISDSICLCPPNQFGPRCYLFQQSCQPEPCMNGGQCLSKDVRLQLTNQTNSMCVCPDGYAGDRCQYQQKQTRIDISFHSEINIPPLLSIHLIAVQLEKHHTRTSIMKKIGFDQDSLTFFTSLWFNIAIAQIFDDYYMIILLENLVTLTHISTEIISSRRCRSISQLFNETFANQHLLKRIKYYHVPCLQQPELVCFYDEVHICLCTLDRTVNCFNFNHNITYDCEGYTYCDNDGYCILDNSVCPTSSFCACHQCYFGSKCQFSTEGSTLSLDIILGYHIQSGNEIRQQSTIVKIAIAFTMTIFIIGCISIFFSLITFWNEETRNVGCGLYLFASSIISLIIVIIFTVKFWLLLASKIGSINNRSFLYIQCVSVDYLLRSLLSINDCLSACVAIERAVNVSQGIKFNRVKSKKIAKWVILIVILFISCTYIYDPFHRALIDDEDEQRTWCVTKYLSFVQVFDRLLNIFYFSLPFSINCISAVLIIITAARSRSNVQKKKSFKEHVREQLQEHKHLLISPLILIALALPRLIISFLSGCMKSARNSWFYLMGYYISFVPAMMIFVVFVLPSEMYKKEFSKSIKQLYHRWT